MLNKLILISVVTAAIANIAAAQSATNYTGLGEPVRTFRHVPH